MGEKRLTATRRCVSRRLRGDERECPTIVVVAPRVPAIEPPLLVNDLALEELLGRVKGKSDVKSHLCARSEKSASFFADAGRKRERTPVRVAVIAYPVPSSSISYEEALLIV